MGDRPLPRTNLFLFVNLIRVSNLKYGSLSVLYYLFMAARNFLHLTLEKRPLATVLSSIILCQLVSLSTTWYNTIWNIIFALYHYIYFDTNKPKTYEIIVKLCSYRKLHISIVKSEAFKLQAQWSQLRKYDCLL